MKFIFFFLAFSFFAWVIAPTAFACDLVSCVVTGTRQDTLILGEAMDAKDDSRVIQIFFIFPQNKVSSLKEGDQITVTNLSYEITVGKKYLMSLNKNDDLYTPAWGIYEITGTTYADARLIEPKTEDETKLQVIMNAGGAKKDLRNTINASRYGIGLEVLGLMGVLAVIVLLLKYKWNSKRF